MIQDKGSDPKTSEARDIDSYLVRRADLPKRKSLGEIALEAAQSQLSNSTDDQGANNSELVDYVGSIREQNDKVLAEGSWRPVVHFHEGHSLPYAAYAEHESGMRDRIGLFPEETKALSEARELAIAHCVNEVLPECVAPGQEVTEEELNAIDNELVYDFSALSSNELSELKSLSNLSAEAIQAISDENQRRVFEDMISTHTEG